ncbi:MAG: hypothetical protein EOO88_17990, partial [Pedobacter sp.]
GGAAQGLLVHRLAGRIAQIGSRDLASEFRELEIEIQNGLPPAAIAEELKVLVVSLEKLIASVRSYSIS